MFKVNLQHLTLIRIQDKRLGSRYWSIVLTILIINSLLTVIDHQSAWAVTAKSKYFAAERCYQTLLKSPGNQKYRDQWLRCINRFLAVHQHDPNGSWAAAGLYQAGVLYSRLAKYSGLTADRQEAFDLFSRVIRRYPKSTYAGKARQAKKNLGQSKADHRFTARQWYKKAQSAYQYIQNKPSLKKRRDKWLNCIDYFDKAYQSNPKGLLAAAALFGKAQAYAGLFNNSFIKADQIKAEQIYRQLIREFPNSSYAQKARAALTDNGSANQNKQDAIAQVIQNTPPIAPVAKPAQNNVTSSPTVVENLRFWSNPRYTRVVIDADKDTTFSYHELRKDPAINKPQRIYIDVHNSRLGRNIQKVIPINDNLLRDARAGQYTKDNVRVVVYIKSFKTYKIFSLKNPFRIVLDVWSVDTDDAKSAPMVVTPEKPGQKPTPGSLVKQLALGVRRIVIDPGHGGKDYGAPGYLRGTHEKNVALQIAKRLATKVRKELGCEVVLTRETDKYLSLEERMGFANAQDADLFISIHTNASPDKRAYGIETYINNLATDDEAIRVAARENATSTKNISDLDSILKSLMQTSKVNESTRLASYVHQSVIKSLKGKYKYIKSKGVKQAPFYVLMGAQMPAILFEASFISHPRECKRLNSTSYQDRLCNGMVKGIQRYMKETNPMALQRAKVKEPG